MSEWTDLKAALDSGAAIHAGEAYRIFMRATREEARLFGGTSSDAAPFLKADYGGTFLPQGIYEKLQATRGIRLIDPDLPGFVPRNEADERIPKPRFTAINRTYLASVYEAYNRLRRYWVAGYEGMYLKGYRCQKTFAAAPASVWDAYLACREELVLDNSNTPRAGIGFKFSYHPGSGTVPASWTGQLDVSVPFFRLLKPSGAVFSREAFLCVSTWGQYDFNWRGSPREYLNFAGPDGYSSGDAFEFIPDAISEVIIDHSGGMQPPVTYLEGSYRIPDLPEASLRAASLYTDGDWGYALENGWQYGRGFILRREYTDCNQYLSVDSVDDESEA